MRHFISWPSCLLPLSLSDIAFSLQVACLCSVLSSLHPASTSLILFMCHLISDIYFLYTLIYFAYLCSHIHSHNPALSEHWSLCVCPTYTQLASQTNHIHAPSSPKGRSQTNHIILHTQITQTTNSTLIPHTLIQCY
jgi:hypothetical protein